MKTIEDVLHLREYYFAGNWIKWIRLFIHTEVKYDFGIGSWDAVLMTHTYYMQHTYLQAQIDMKYGSLVKVSE